MPRVTALVNQITFEGGFWDDEGTRMVLWAWKPENEDYAEAFVVNFDEDLNLGEFEEALDVNSMIQDEGWWVV